MRKNGDNMSGIKPDMLKKADNFFNSYCHCRQHDYKRARVPFFIGLLFSFIFLIDQLLQANHKD